jgi:hypothetical protein
LRFVHLGLGLALFVSAQFADAGDPARSAIAMLAQTGRVSCEPLMAVFCSNIHVACSGPSSIKTFPFVLRATRTQGAIESASDTDGITDRYKNASVEWHNEDEYVLLRPREGIGYVKMLADGTYSFRHYPEHAGLMSRGVCSGNQ